MVHCRMGIGRSSIVIASLMVKLGYNLNDIWQIIRKNRTLQVPDTEEQKKWVASIEHKLKNKM